MLRSASDNRAFPMSTHGAIRPKACGKATMGGAAYSSARKACESWTLAAELRRRIQAMEMRCYRKLLGISYKDHVTNEEVRAKIQQAVGSNEDILTTVKRRKLQWCGHVSRSSGLAKTILLGTVKGGRRQGRQRERWEDNISEGCCRLQLTSLFSVIVLQPPLLCEGWGGRPLCVYGVCLRYSDECSKCYIP